MSSQVYSDEARIYPSISVVENRTDDIQEDDPPNETKEKNGGASVVEVEANANAVSLEMGEIGAETGAEQEADVKEKAQAILKELRGDLTYAIEDVPPWYNCLLLGFQHYLTMFGATLAMPLLLASSLCIKDNLVAQGELISTIFAVSGLVTLLQTTFGVRLPIVQGGTFSFLAPALTILNQQGPCPSPPAPGTPSAINASFNGSEDYTTMPATTVAFDDEEFWRRRMRVVQGSIMIASVVEVIVGFTGIVGIMLRFIGPLTIAPTITLIGLSLFDAAISFSSGHWGIAFLTIALMALFSQYIARFTLPCLGFSREKKCHRVSFPLFKMFPVILSVLIAWAFSAILTAANVFPTDPDAYGYSARTDLRIGVLEESAWVKIPYPGQWGVPTATIAGVFGMLAGVLASIFESVGDYYACARLAGAPPPPVHAINRGIGIEGLGCILAGAFGSGSGTTSYGENIGALGITKVGSRRAIQYGGMLMILMGMFAKFGALFVTIPDPIIGGMFCVMFAMVAAVGISNLQFVNLNSSRNLFVIGFSLIMGFIIPTWVRANRDFFKTGNEEIDQIIVVLLETNMFVGGVIGFFFDNTLPGSDEDRGIAQWRSKYSAGSQDSALSRELLRSYEFPVGMNWIRRFSFFRYIPFSPTYTGFPCNCCGSVCGRIKKLTRRDNESEETHM
ncbi:solute carrier family 23 member 1-like isoform X2 [Acanthaster planci]|uniref:Solute carrier family 23 member 1-like isoform X2 n=1 Tax=Acanthaster planci TaxID=133434 RepID=A0A8B7XIS7_ACAPL|nr:solute carrier family 23 member 1-like isoform X2 [Acanthaster planci]